MPGKKLSGRPRGRKNNATLLKESEIAKCLKLCEGHAALEAPKIVIAMAEKAKNGDVAAAKLILDRVYPAKRQVDDRGPGLQGITINITSTETSTEEKHHGQTIDQNGSEADPVAGQSAEGDQPFRHEGVQIVPIDGGKAR